MNQSENHEQHESVLQTLARLEDQVARLEACMMAVQALAAAWKDSDNDEAWLYAAKLERALEIDDD